MSKFGSLQKNSKFVLQMKFAIQQIDDLDKKRIKQALASDGESFQHIFQLLSLLLHYNHPLLPGYIKDAPQGIWQFIPSTYQKKYLEKLKITDDTCEVSFDGIYAMGSTGTISQTSLSDLDIWVCSEKNFNLQQETLVKSKFALIKEWASTFKVEINFYLMNPKQFKNQLYHNKVTKDNSGSAQHFFLLDEFYRSAIRLSGKRLLWLHLLKEDNQTYQNMIDNAVSQGLDLNEWIDFGDFSALSIDEVFGASLWQLYKSINSPYKSVLKILLLESYTKNYPVTDLISKQFKRMLLNNKEKKNYHFDPYLAILECVTEYLVNNKDYERLECIRSCFYIKITSDKKIQNWRAETLNSLVSQWNWSQKQIDELSSRENWKIKQAMAHHQMLFNVFMQSYHYLIGFLRMQNIEPCILSQDSDILMRQLYSIFENLPGKVPLLSNKIKWNLAEDAITFVEASGANKGWYLLNHSPKIIYNSSQRYSQYFPHLIQLIAWAYFNGLITVNTQIHLISKTVKLPQLRQFITDLRLHIPVKSPLPSSEAWHQPNEIRHLAVVVNLYLDPTKKMKKIPKKLALKDILHLGSAEYKVVGSIALIYRNMWNEIRTEYFEGDNAVLDALKLLSNKLYQSNFAPESLNVFCYSKYLNKELQHLISLLVNRCIVIQTGINYQNQLLMRSGISNKKWQFVFEDSSTLSNQAIQLSKEFTKEQNSIKNCSIPREIGNFAIEGFIQFFFEDISDTQFNVYILDEKNILEYYLNCKGSKDKKVRLINTTYAEKKAQRISFSFPQFYQIIEKKEQKTIRLFESFA